MAKERVVLVDGVSGDWGGRVAERLLDEPDLHVIGLDAAPPEHSSGLDYIQADMRNPLLTEFLKEERVHTYVHLGFQETDRPTEAAFEYNVMGTMKVLSACASAGVKHVVLKSSTLVYGARPGNSAFLREEHPLNAPRTHGTLRDLLEIEAFCQTFRVQSPQVKLTTLRFAHIIGPTTQTAMTGYLQDDVVPMLLGFDPVIQLIHEEDVVNALAWAAIYEVPGVFNVGAAGAMPLFKLIGLAGKRHLPILHPLAYLGSSMMGPHLLPFDADYLRYVCVGDLRRMREELEFQPAHTAEEAVRQFVTAQQSKVAVPGLTQQEAEEEQLRAVIERRKTLRRQMAAGAPVRRQPRGSSEATSSAVPADSSI
jgi:UDP-glucose 4-epimerase